ncbi:MAG: hypothetical protein QOD67_130 [Caballeronia sp.]|jgi:hypothetical protein|nr:hypothetical protein [Caballeronia sp.]
MIRFYFHPTPNPAKVALFLEEAGLQEPACIEGFRARRNRSAANTDPDIKIG